MSNTEAVVPATEDEELITVDLTDDKTKEEVPASKTTEQEKPPTQVETKTEAVDGEDGDKTQVEEYVDKVIDVEDKRKEFGQRAEKRIRTLVAKSKDYEQALITERSRNVALEAEKAALLAQNQTNVLSAWQQAEGRLKASVETAEKELKDATVAGDAEAQAAAVKKMSTFSAELTRASENRQRAEVQAKRPKVEKVEDTTVKPRTQERVVPQPSETALKWRDSNKTWFGQNKIMTDAAQTIHNEMYEEGIDASENEEAYFKELDSRMRAEFPHKFKVKSGASDSTQNVAAPTRAKAVISKNQVKLTKSQAAMAARLGISLVDYARGLKQELENGAQ